MNKKLEYWQECGHRTFWWNAKKVYNIERPTKYCIVFNTYTDSPGSFSVTPFDTLDEALEEAKLLNEMYNNTPKPERVYSDEGPRYINKKWVKRYTLDYSNGGYFWGYMVLDMINNRIVKIVNDINRCGYTFNKDNKNKLSTIDVLFRGDDEIPNDYIWDRRGEYEGWLQFRWGDKKNALDYVEPPKKERPGVDEIWEVYDETTETYIKKKVRVVYVNWDDPLPTPQKGIEYLRPNKEPVIFPGDEYIDNDGTFKPEPMSNSIADLLGNDNPLLKIKNKLENESN